MAGTDPFGRGTSSSSSGPDPFGRGGSSSSGPDPFRGSRGGPVSKSSPSGSNRNVLGKVAHYAGQKLDLAARDLKAIPGGIVQINKAAAHDIGNGFENTFTLGHYGKPGSQAKPELLPIAKQLAESSKQTLQHPLRDPFATATLLSPIGHGIGKAGIALKEGAAAAKAGEGAAAAAKATVKGVAKRPEDIPRPIRSGGSDTHLIPSRNAGARVVQAGYDKVLQRGLDKNPEGRVAAHAQKRIGGALKEEARVQQKMRAVPASLLDKAAGKLSKTRGARREEQAALELTSAQTTAEEAARYHRTQAANGVNAKQNLAVAKLYDRVGKRGLVKLDESRPAGQKVFISPAHEALAKTDAALANVQARGDRILVDKGVREGAALKSRVNAPGRVRAGGSFKHNTLGEASVPAAAIGRSVKATMTSERSAFNEAYRQYVQDDPFAPDRMTRDEYAAMHPELEGGAPLVRRFQAPAKVEAVNTEASTASVRFFKKNGGTWTKDVPLSDVQMRGGRIVGGETARPGRGFVSARVSEKKLGKAEASAARGPVVGAAKTPIDSKTFTGRSIEQGLVPKNVTSSASQHFRQIVRFVNTDAMRRRALETGSDIRRSSRDVLVRVPDEKSKPLTTSMEQAVGKQKSTVDTAEELATQEGLRAAHDAFLEHLIPDIKARFANDRAQPVGVKAEPGYKWVDRHALGDLTSPPSGPRGKIARSVDTVNSAITAATVYFKVGHVGTRVLTNAATNIIQGSARPRELGKSADLWHALDDEQKARALAAAGQHGFAALPHEGTNAVSHVASKGAQFWARHADAMFRFNSLSYELRRIGYTTPDKFKAALDALESGGHGVSGSEWSKLSAAARRSDREAIAYDRLNDFEKKYITRAVWFYPWIKGSTLFTVRSLIEHPLKGALLGQAGVLGRQTQMRTLGPTPSYESGLFRLGGSDSNPLVSDFSTFSPFSTAADVLQTPAQPGAVSGFFNPALGAAGSFAYGLNSFGSPTNSPYTAALLALGSPTPEQQFAEALAGRNKSQAGHMFHKTPANVLARYLGGPGLPRNVSRPALGKAADRQRSGGR